MYLNGLNITCVFLLLIFLLGVLMSFGASSDPQSDNAASVIFKSLPLML